MGPQKNKLLGENIVENKGKPYSLHVIIFILAIEIGKAVVERNICTKFEGSKDFDFYNANKYAFI